MYVYAYMHACIHINPLRCTYVYRYTYPKRLLGTSKQKGSSTRKSQLLEVGAAAKTLRETEGATEELDASRPPEAQRSPNEGI